LLNLHQLGFQMKMFNGFFVTLLASHLVATGVQAQATADYPNKPTRVVITFPPGGSTDAVVRILMPRLLEKLGQPWVVDNRPGAGGNVGLAIVAKAPPDGYTLGVGAAGGLAANVSLYPQMPFDPVKDFRPITLLASAPFVLVANPGISAKTLPELIAQAKAAPGKFSIGHGGNGTAMHLSSQLFSQMAGVQMVEVPYRGSGPATLDALAGQVPLAMVDLVAALPHIKAGKLLALAVTGTQRQPTLPDVPTMAEGGVAGYESTGWFGLVAPAGTPASVIARLNTEIVAALNDPEIAKAMRAQGVEAAPTRPEEFERFIKSETLKWARVIKTSGTKLE
jgi:tripartite-type tricarboxylate transporter receptor subunit TctC